jgi:hypothetical protein
MSKRAFLICPVRGHDPSETAAIVAELEAKGWTVHWPPRDTDQDDPIGLQICAQNREAIREADRVFVVWDGQSQGCLFDLGMAWAMERPISILRRTGEKENIGKSFYKVIRGWEEVEK